MEQYFLAVRRPNSPIQARIQSSCGYSQGLRQEQGPQMDWLHHTFRKYGQHMRVLTILWPVVLKAVSTIDATHFGR